MCFIVGQNSKQIKIAKEDIVCYKKSNLSRTFDEVNKSKFNPCFRRFTYNLNRRTRRIQLKKRNGFIDKGYHSYTHAVPIRGTSFRVGKFIIPKGAKYYQNDEEYVSETLIFKGWLTEEEINKIIKQEENN